MFLFGCLALLAGFGFKVSMAPFHSGSPTLRGASDPITTLLSIARSPAGHAPASSPAHPAPGPGTHGGVHLPRHPHHDGWNLTALRQTNVKRLLAYSSIAQAGYILIGFVTADELGREGVLLYSLVYLFMNLGAFAVAILVGNEDGYELEAYDGLSRRSLGLSLLMAAFLLSLAGIPPLAGFIGKFSLFAAAVKGGFYTLAVAAVLNSVISVVYYMNIAYHMFFLPARTEKPVEMGVFIYSGLTLAAVALFIGLYPSLSWRA